MIKWNQQGVAAIGSDFSLQVIQLACKNVADQNIPAELFKQCSIYDINSGLDRPDLIDCCEALEHLESPEEGACITTSCFNIYGLKYSEGTYQVCT